MEIERNLSITKGPLLNIFNTTSIQDLSDNHIIEILVRLPVKTIVHCKCVCRDWLNLIADSHFVNLNLTKSPECFVLLDKYSQYPITNPKFLSLVEIEEEHGHNHLHHYPIMRLDLNLAPAFQIDRLCAAGSVNGLICLICVSGSDHIRDKIYICNPITREYMILPKQIQGGKERNTMNCYGFGVSSLTGEYKVVRVFQDIGLSICALRAEIYTLGTGRWRSLTVRHVPYYIDGLNGTFLNSHVHWTSHHKEDPSQNICSFDIDNETFQLFPAPPVGLEEPLCYNRKLGVLKGCLCYSYYGLTLGEFTMFVMKEYGVKNSWQKEVLINLIIYPIVLGSDDILCSPIASLKDGSILIMCVSGKLLVYHPHTCSIEMTQFADVDAISYRPSFLKLQTFESESVHKFLR